jgi:glycosyltransferase involved in cell wall biosynthesis
MAGGRVKVAFVVQGFGYGRGRATTMVELAKPLPLAGHRVEAFVTAVVPRHDVEGIQVRRFSEFGDGHRFDVVVYNSGLPRRVLDAIAHSRARLLMCQHSYVATDPGLAIADKVWFPSMSALRADRGSTYKRFVSPPPINPALYRTKPGDRISLSLSSPHKGAPVAAYLARAMPQQRFLIVKDPRGHGVSLFRGMSNVDLVEFMQPRHYYAATRVQLFPSRSETYGRVAVEAAVSGIPTVSSGHSGIREAMGGAGLFLDRTNARDWLHVVKRLMTDDAYWRKWSRVAARRGREIDYAGDQEAFRLEVEAMR